MKHINFSKYVKKYQITFVYLCKYLADWKERNCFYYGTLAEIKTLSKILNQIETGVISISNEEYSFLRDIARAKQIKYGKYEYSFKNK